MQSCFSIAIWAQAQQTPPLAAVLLRCATMVPTAAPPASPSCGETPTLVESPSWAPTLTWTPTLVAADPESPSVEVVGGASAAGGEPPAAAPLVQAAA